jgi:hypothetical protein
MHISREELEQTFESLSDAELLRRLTAGELTPLAREVAETELRRRGLPAPDPASPADRTTDERKRDDIVEVARFLTPTEAYILQGRLQAEGVPAVVADAGLVQTNALLAIAVGGVRVMVPQSLRAAAEEIKAAIARGDYTLEEDEPVPEQPD